jgi:phage terminase large subunit-like protein
MDLTKLEEQELAAIAAELERRANYKINKYFQDDGPYRRELYPKHLAFMRAGAVHRERLFLKANRVGGTEMGAYEMALHLTGAYDEYAPWWEGRRFNGPIKAWAAGDTSKTTRDIQQTKLMGPIEKPGTGMLPTHLIQRTTPKAGVPGAIENVWVRHVSGGLSLLQFKSYDQKREGFQGTEQHVIWNDEECPQDIYEECLLRTAATSDFEGGLLMLTFTPLMGMTPLVLSFLPGGKLPATMVAA